MMPAFTTKDGSTITTFSGHEHDSFSGNEHGPSLYPHTNTSSWHLVIVALDAGERLD
jgi:hypothetical protein